MKSNQKLVRQRVEEILALRLLGALATDIRRHAEEAKWGVSLRQLQRYTAAADELMAEALAENRPRLMGYHFAARRALYARAMSVSDYGTAARVLKDEAELFGLYAAKKIEASGPAGGPLTVELTNDERDAAIAAVLARLGQGHGGPADPGQADADGCVVGAAGVPADPGGDDPGPLADGPAPLFG